VHQRRVAAARAPRITSLVHDRAAGSLHLQFRSEPGAIYQLWGLSDLTHGAGTRELLDEFEADAESTDLDLTIMRDVPRYFYQVSDLLP